MVPSISKLTVTLTDQVLLNTHNEDFSKFQIPSWIDENFRVIGLTGFEEDNCVSDSTKENKKITSIWAERMWGRKRKVKNFCWNWKRCHFLKETSKTWKNRTTDYRNTKREQTWWNIFDEKKCHQGMEEKQLLKPYKRCSTGIRGNFHSKELIFISRTWKLS